MQFQCNSLISKKYQVKDWIDDLQRRGRITFELKEVYKEFPLRTRAGLKNILSRLVKKGNISSVWKGFYVIIPIEFSSKGIVPPVMYIDNLMSYLQKPYYISLLSAAVFYGAAHQRPQEFSVVTTSGSLRSSIKKGVKINFSIKKEIAEELIIKKKTKTGYVNVSSPELTAVDLVLNERKVGGLNRVATVLNELSGELNFKQLPELFFSQVSSPILQRLGYLLDVPLGNTMLSDELLYKMKKSGCNMRKTLLKNRNPVSNCIINKKWRIIINEQIEIEE